jgi:hypothetical protein
MTKTWRAVMVMVAALALPAAVLAHGGHLHKALGTIARIDGVHVDVKTTDGKTIMLVVDKKTAVTRGKDKLDATALKAGERVSVDYMEENKMMMARAIKLSTARAAK